MADITLVARSALDGLDVTIGACRLRERSDLELVSIAIPHGGEADLAAELQTTFGLEKPDPRLSRVSGGAYLLGLSPDQLMLVLSSGAGSALEVAERIGETGYLTDQSDNWAICEMSGPGTHAALERLCPVDLDDTAFPVGAFARTMMEHMNARILRTGPETYLLMSSRSSARSFAHALELSMTYTA